MGSNQFQREYIEYLQERNTELLNRLNQMKDSYENKIVTKNFNRHYLMSTLEDVSNICTIIPQEIDLFFDKMTSAMSILKNILVRKSEMVQLAEKISKALNSTENFNSELMAVDSTCLVKDPITESRNCKKSGTVKVSPMINGHIISTEPRIYLSRVPEVFTPNRRNETQQLSPIIEASPDTSSDPSNTENHSFRDNPKPVTRLNLNKLSYNFGNEESPKTRFKGPKTWKKSLSSNKCQSSSQRNTVFLETNENISKKLTDGGIENVDPLEGPSWLHNENSEKNSSPSRFIDYRRRKHRFATVFDKNEEYISYYEEKAENVVQKDANEFYDNHEKSNDEKEDFKDLRRISESSEDLIGESFKNDNDENISPSFKKRCKVSRRKISRSFDEEICDKNESGEFDINYKEEITSFSKIKKKKSTLKTSIQLNSPNEGDTEDGAQEVRKLRNSYTKRSLRSIEKSSGDLSVDRTSCKSQTDDKKNRISEGKRKDMEDQKKSLFKEALAKNVFVKLEDCMAIKEVSGNSRPKSTNGRGQSSTERRILNKEFESEIISLENEGRKRRKAAPSSLAEPKLNSKLRRN